MAEVAQIKRKTGIRLWRFVDSNYALYRSYEVFINNNHHCDLPPNTNLIDIDLEEGKYSIHVKMDWCESNPQTVIVTRNHLISMKIAVTSDRLLGMFLRPKYFFQLIPSPPGPGFETE